MTGPDEMTDEAFVDLSRFELDRETIQRLPEALCRRHHVVPLGRGPHGDGQAIALGMLDPTDEAAVYDVQRATHWRIRRVQLNAYEIDAALAYGFGRDAESTPAGPGLPRLDLSHERTIAFSRDQPLPGIVADVLSQAVSRRASDVHLEVYRNDVDVRFRIDGVLVQVATPLSLANAKNAVSYLKNLAGLDMIERRRAQDGRIGTDYRDASGQSRRIDLRVSVLPGPHGEDVVLRVLDQQRIDYGLDELGMPTTILETFRALLHTPGGIILVTGPTASGKTTTLYAALAEINTDQNKLLTVEDPIEYHLPRVNQKQVTDQMSFADYARAFMRQNPDVVMIGEVRDEETAQIALRAAQMGHLVLTTLHTRDAPSAVARLLSLGSDRSIVASGMLGALSQRLVRKVCRHCAEPYTPSAELFKLLPAIAATAGLVKGKGCDVCRGTGYLGQLGVFELLAFDDGLRHGIAGGADPTWASLPDVPCMFDDAMEKMIAGLTTPEEILRAVPLPDRLHPHPLNPRSSAPTAPPEGAER